MRFAFATILVLAACGSDGISVSTNSKNFCSQIADVACHNMYQCCSEGTIESALHVSDPRTEEQCRTDLTRICDTNAVALNDSIQNKRVTFDSKRMNDCLNAIVAPSGVCNDIVTELPWTKACMTTAFVGTVAPGGRCLFAFDCEGYPDALCGVDQKCQQKGMAGFPCGSGCATNFYCNMGFCTDRIAEGQPCTASSQCKTDLFCDLNATPTPICKSAQPGGAMCTSSLECKSNTCVPGQCAGTMTTCFKDSECTGHCAGTGASCTTSAGCGLGNCSVGGNSCSADTNCTAGSGDHCVFPVVCQPGSCVGTPVCTDEIIDVNYCDATSALPVI